MGKREYTIMGWVGLGMNINGLGRVKEKSPQPTPSTGLRSTNALNINFFLLPTKFLQPVNLAILII